MISQTTLFWATALLGALALLVVGVSFWGDAAAFARDAQRMFQTELAGAIRAARAGDPWAYLTVIGVCGGYGVAHAIGPGHGKLLIAGAGAATDRSALATAGLGLAASLCQGVTAILLVYGGLGLFALAGGAAIGTAEAWLAPLSYAAMGAVGVWLFIRGLRALREKRHHHGHSGAHSGCGAGCKHAPTAEEVANIASWRDAVALVLSIGVRPCSGALILLVIAWRFELYALGAAGAMAMAVGTGVIVSGVGAFSSTIRALMLSNADGAATAASLKAWAMLLAGGAVALLCALLLHASLTADTPRSGPFGAAPAAAASLLT